MFYILMMNPSKALRILFLTNKFWIEKTRKEMQIDFLEVSSGKSPFDSIVLLCANRINRRFG